MVYDQVCLHHPDLHVVKLHNLRKIYWNTITPGFFLFWEKRFLKFTHFILLFACRICRIEINFIILALSMNYEQRFQNGIVYIFRCYHVHLYSYLILIPVCYDFYYDTTFFFFSSGTDKKTLFNPNTLYSPFLSVQVIVLVVLFW